MAGRTKYFTVSKLKNTSEILVVKKMIIIVSRSSRLINTNLHVSINSINAIDLKYSSVNELSLVYKDI